MRKGKGKAAQGKGNNNKGGGKKGGKAAAKSSNQVPSRKSSESDSTEKTAPAEVVADAAMAAEVLHPSRSRGAFGLSLAWRSKRRARIA